jgi:hypothetical protein
MNLFYIFTFLKIDLESGSITSDRSTRPCMWTTSRTRSRKWGIPVQNHCSLRIRCWCGSGQKKTAFVRWNLWFNNKFWSAGPELPKPLFGAVMVQYGLDEVNSFFCYSFSQGSNKNMRVTCWLFWIRGFQFNKLHKIIT